MKIIKVTDTLKMICADEGKIVTNGVYYGSKISTGINANEERFYEITKAEYEEILRKQEENILI